LELCALTWIKLAGWCRPVQGAQHYREIDAPETTEYKMEVAGFFDRHLGK
jgi:hypothetical protein